MSKTSVGKLAAAPIWAAPATLSALGGLAGGGLKYLKARSEGAEREDALREAGKGALLGAGAGAVAGGVGKLIPQTRGVTEGVGNWGLREVHGLTGWLPKSMDEDKVQALRSIGGGAHDAIQGYGRALEQSRAAVHAPGITGKAKDKILAHAQRGVQLAEAQKNIAEDLERRGMTHLRGIATNIHKDPKGSLSLLGKNVWQGSAKSKALMVGLPLLSAVNTLRSKEEETGVGKGEALGSLAGNLVGNVMTSPLGFFGGQLAGEPIGRLGKAIGRGVDRLRGVKPLPLEHRYDLVPPEGAEQRHPQLGTTGATNLDRAYG